MVEKIKDFFKINKTYGISKKLLFVILVTTIFTYSLLIINYYACPDGVIEGISYFHNADWSLQGGGRWLIRYIGLQTGNLVFPLIIVTQYGICSFISTLLLKKIWDIKSNIVLYLIGITLVCSPTAIFLMTYTYTGFCIGISVLLGILFTYINFNINKKYSVILSTITMMLLLATDQGFIGVASTSCALTIIIKLIKKEDAKVILLKTLKCILTAIVGGLTYMVSIKIALSIHHMSAIDNARLGGFSFSLILKEFPIKFLETYSKIFGYFEDYVLKRKYLFICIFCIALIVVVVRIISLIRENKHINAIVAATLVVLLPPISYIIAIIVPYYKVYLAMEYQCSILIVFAIALTELLNVKIIKIVQISLASILCWTYILSANATYRCFEISYNHINTEMSMVLYDVYHTDGYKKNETPIIMAGFPNDKDIREQDKTYRYAIEFPVNPVFWEDMTGAIYGRKEYFKYYLGVDAKDISYEDYRKIVYNEEFTNMPSWPLSGSVKMIDGYCVIKFSGEIPMP